MNKHRSYLSIHIYTFRYDCCVHCNWHHFFLLLFFLSFFFFFFVAWLASRNWQTLKCPDRSRLSSVSSRHGTLHTVAYWEQISDDLSYDDHCPQKQLHPIFFWLDSSLWSVELDYFNFCWTKKKEEKKTPSFYGETSLKSKRNMVEITTQHFNKMNMEKKPKTIRSL